MREFPAGPISWIFAIDCTLITARVSGVLKGKQLFRVFEVCAFTAAMLIAPSQVGFAQQGVTRIYVVFQNYYERVRPGYAAGIVNEEMTVLLSGKNSVQETYTSSNSQATQSWNSNNTLGSGRWRVAGANKLVRTIRTLQSIRTDVILVSGSSCTASAKFELLPGFSEYEIYSIGLHALAYYKQARMQGSTCAITSN